MLNPEIMNKLETIREHEQKINRKKKKLYKGCKTKYDFIKFKTIQSFEDAIRNGKLTMDLANEEQN